MISLEMPYSVLPFSMAFAKYVLHGFFIPGTDALEARDCFTLGNFFRHLVHWQRCDAWIVCFRCGVGKLMTADGGDTDKLNLQFAK